MFIFGFGEEKCTVILNLGRGWGLVRKGEKIRALSILHDPFLEEINSYLKDLDKIYNYYQTISVVILC